MVSNQAANTGRTRYIAARVRIRHAKGVAVPHQAADELGARHSAGSVAVGNGRPCGIAD